MALPDYLESSAKDFARQLTASTSAPIDTTKFTGRQFVAGEDPLQTQAINLATAGIGGFQPFLTSAQQAITQAGQDVGAVRQDLAGLGQFMGTGAGTGAGSIAAFTSPFQQQVIDESLRQFDRSRAGGLQQIADRAAGFGAFGGGRQGALEGQFMADTALGRAGLEAQLRAQGFADAVGRRGQAFGQQQALANQRANLANQQAGLAQNQFALSNFQQAGRASDVANLGQLGAFRQGLTQSQLQADMDAARTAAFEPQQRLQQYGGGLGQLAGFASPAPIPGSTPSPFSTALSTALGIGGLFGKFRS
jgi:hypothetical protein|tara:strand:- start:46 stop:963 length:918 start_codon:yes stop_codon:yes gene_type:complete